MRDQVDMTGKVCLVTGATSGIGLETSRALARMGATVILVSRTAERGERAIDELRDDTGSQHLRLFVADLSCLGEIRRLATEIRQSTESLDVLINNAGVMRGRRSLTPDGLEITFAVNHLAPFLLTNLLLDLLRQAAPSRIVTVSSNAHHWSGLQFDNLQGERRYNEWKAYGQSKLANIIFTYALVRRLEGESVTANCCHPGFVVSGLTRGGSWIVRLTSMLGSPFKIEPAQGADTVIFLATSPAVAEVSGRYFYRREAIDSSDASYDEADWERLWEISERLTGLGPVGTPGDAPTGAMGSAPPL